LLSYDNVRIPVIPLKELRDVEILPKRSQDFRDAARIDDFLSGLSA
jgi:hypothetical protein